MFNTSRSKEKEIMDLGHDFYTPQEYKECLKILFKINKLMGFFKHTVKVLKDFPSDSVLADVGCGGGLFLLHLSQYYPKMRLLGFDISKDAINTAQNELEFWSQKNRDLNLKFQLQKQPDLEIPTNTVDIILLTLVCHHLDDDELILFLQKAYSTVSKALVINDLHRNFVAYWFYKILSPLFRNRLITHDGLISIQRGFKRKELEYLLQQAHINNYKIKWHFPFRWSIVISK